MRPAGAESPGRPRSSSSWACGYWTSAVRAGFPRESVRFDTAPMAIREFAAKQAAGSDARAAEAVAGRKFRAGEYAPGSGWEVLIGRKPPAVAG